MTDLSQRSDNLGLALGDMRGRWGWFVALGIVFMIFGFIAFMNLFIATVASVFTVGVLMLVGAVMQMVHAFGVRSWKSFIWWFLAGLVYAVAGIAALINPLLTSVFLTLFLAAALIAGGAFRIWAGWKERPGSNWGWMVAAGIITLIAGLVIALGWPINSLWVLGLFLAIDLIMQGASFLALGLSLRRSRTAAEA